MTEVIQREIAEIERQRDAFARLDRIGNAERDIAVLRTRFEAAFDTFLKELERAVSAEDLKQLKREWETALRDAISGVSDLVKSANDQQSREMTAQAAQDKRDILNRVEAMFSSFQTQNMQAQIEQSRELLASQARTRSEIIRYGVGFALTVLSALLIFYFTERM